MASYMRNPMFGQDSSYDSPWAYNASGGDYYTPGEGYTPGYTGEPEGTGVTASPVSNVAGWLNLGAAAIGLGAQVYNVATGQPNVAAQPVPGLSTPVARPPTVVPSGSSSMILIGALALGAFFFLKK